MADAAYHTPPKKLDDITRHQAIKFWLEIVEDHTKLKAEHVQMNWLLAKAENENDVLGAELKFSRKVVCSLAVALLGTSFAVFVLVAALMQQVLYR